MKRTFILSFVLCITGCTVISGPSGNDSTPVTPTATIVNSDAKEVSLTQDTGDLNETEIALINGMLAVGKELGSGDSGSILAPSRILTPSLATGSQNILLPSAFRILAIAGFTWKDGWYFADNNTDKKIVKLRFEDNEGKSLDYDATDPSLPKDKQIDNFPTLTKSHVSVISTGPGGGKVIADLFGNRPKIMPQPKDWMDIEGTGKLSENPIFTQLDFTMKIRGRADNSEVEGTMDFITPQPLDGHTYTAQATISNGFKDIVFKKDGVERAKITFENGVPILKIGEKVKPFVPAS